MADIFRKSALERLSSSEELDKAITVSKPISWLALLGITIITVAVVIWSFCGMLPTTLTVSGIAVTSSNSLNEQIIECFVSYAEAIQIKSGMSAVVRDKSNNKRYEAEVIKVDIDDKTLSNIELVFGTDDIFVALLKITTGELDERTLVQADIIIEEVAPINMLFKDFSGR